MEQTIFNWLLAAVGALLGLIVKFIWSVVVDIQEEHKKLVDHVIELDKLVVGKYITREESMAFSSKVYNKLDNIESKLDHKADKADCHDNHGKS